MLYSHTCETADRKNKLPWNNAYATKLTFSIYKVKFHYIKLEFLYLNFNSIQYRFSVS